MKIIAKIFTLTMAFGLLAGIATAQDTEKKVVMNPDGSYSVIEYPVGKEVVLNLLPIQASTVAGTARARVLRAPDGTKVYFDVTGAPADWKTVHAYAVDPSGATTYLGPIDFSSGVGKAEFTTPLNQFMVVVSTSEGLTTYDPMGTYIYRSELPKGYAVVPRRVTDTAKAVARAEGVNSTYDVPMLGVPKFEGKTTEVRVNFTGDLKGLDGKAYLKPEGGKTSIKMRFGDLRKVPSNKRLVLWAAGADGKYTKIGQVINTGGRDESEIRGDTAMSDFGLLVTVEDVDVDHPTSTIYAPFRVSTNP